MAEITMLPMAVMTANKKGRSLSEVAAGRKDLYLTEGPTEKADITYLPDYGNPDFRQVHEPLTVGKHVLFGTMGAADADSLNALTQIAAGHDAVLLDYIHLAFNPCMVSLETTLICLRPIYRIRFYSCEYVFRYKGVCTAPVRPFIHIPQGNALFQRGYDCIYPLVHLFGIPGQLDIQMISTENGMDVAGVIRGTLGSARVEIVYSKVPGNHILSPIEGERGCLLIRDLRNLREVTYSNCPGVEKPMVSFSEEAYRARELDHSTALTKGNCDQRLQLVSSLQALQMMDEIRGGKETKDLISP